MHKDTDFISVDEAYEMYWECPPAQLPLQVPAKRAKAPMLRKSKVRDQLRFAIRGIEKNGFPVVVDLTGEKPLLRSKEELEHKTIPKPVVKAVQEPVPEVVKEPTPDEIFNLGLAAITSNIHAKRQERQQSLAESPTTIPREVVPQDNRPLPRVAPWPPPKPSLSERWKMYREERREKRRYKEPHSALHRAIGVVAAVGLVFTGSLAVTSLVSHDSSPQEATPTVALNVHDVPSTTIHATTTTTIKQSMPQLTQEEAKAVITISSARHSVEVAHPEFTQSQVDVYFMGAMDYAARIQGASTTQS